MAARVDQGIAVGSPKPTPEVGNFDHNRAAFWKMPRLWRTRSLALQGMH